MKELNGLLMAMKESGYRVMRIEGFDRITSDGKEFSVDGERVEKGVYLDVSLRLLVRPGSGVKPDSIVAEDSSS